MSDPFICFFAHGLFSVYLYITRYYTHSKYSSLLIKQLIFDRLCCRSPPVSHCTPAVWLLLCCLSLSTTDDDFFWTSRKLISEEWRRYDLESGELLVGANQLFSAQRRKLTSALLTSASPRRIKDFFGSCGQPVAQVMLPCGCSNTQN